MRHPANLGHDQHVHPDLLNLSSAEGFLSCATSPLSAAFAASRAFFLSVFSFSSFARMATYVHPYEQTYNVQKKRERKRRTAFGSITFFLCFLRYLFKLLPLPLILLFSRSSLSFFFASPPSPVSSSSSSEFSSVTSTLPDTRRRSIRGRRAYGTSVVGVPSTEVVSFDGGASEPTNDGSRVMRSGWICGGRGQ